MNEFEGWLKIIQQYQGVQKLVNLNQNLYDQLTGAIFYLKKYADELDLPLKKRRIKLDVRTFRKYYGFI